MINILGCLVFILEVFIFVALVKFAWIVLFTM